MDEYNKLKHIINISENVHIERTLRKLLSYNEFINEDYRDVAAAGRGGIHADDKLSNSMGLAGVGSNTTLDNIADPSGEKKLLGTEEMKIKDPYFAIRKKKEKLKTEVEEEKLKRMRKNAFAKLNDLDKKTLEK
jgi:hypothetical protein